MSSGSGGCSTCEVSEKRGCGVSSVFDWLYQIDGPKTDNSNLVEVQFKGDRKDFYVNVKNLEWNNIHDRLTNHEINDYKPLITRITNESIEAMLDK